MNILAFIIGVGVVAGLILFFINTLKKNEHEILKIFMMFIFLSLILFVPKALVDNNDFCEIVANETITTYSYNADNLTANTTATTDYARTCFTDSKTTANIFFKTITGVIGVVWLYVFVYLLWLVFATIHKKIQKNKKW